MKRPVKNNKRGTSEKQARNKRETSEARRSYRATTQTPGAVIRPGAAREFQFREYADLCRSVKRAGINKLPRDRRTFRLLPVISPGRTLPTSKRHACWSVPERPEELLPSSLNA